MSAYQLNLRRLRTFYYILAVFALLYIAYNYVNHPSINSPTAGFAKEKKQGPNQESSDHDLLNDIFNSTLGFQKIFTINLASRTDRRDASALAAVYTGLEIEYIDGATRVDEKAWPHGMKEANLSHGGTANWRSHMNVLRIIVEQNISSALILEDDADWDIRIKSQMRDFAKASRLLVQPLPGTTDAFLDPTWPQPSDEYQTPVNLDIHEKSTGQPTTSPYGDLDRWDMLWIGHCGCRFPWAADKNVPLGRAVIPNDETVPARSHLQMEFGSTEHVKEYPDYTRVVSRSRVNTCTLAYAITQEGARHMLYELGVHKVDGTNDEMFRFVCDGAEGRNKMICLSPQPALFNHHRPVSPRSSWSDIDEHEGMNEFPVSTNIRWATRVNLGKLVRGETDYIDSYEE